MPHSLTGDHKRMRRRLTPFVILLLHTCTYAAEVDCDPGWFGTNCQFKCHCEPNSNCDFTTGQCQSSSKCAIGWFGSSCQYKDIMSDSIATINSSPAQTSYLWITDRNDTTCNNDVSLTKLIITFQWMLPFTWLRLTMNDTEYLGSLTLSFTSASSVTKCIDQMILVINTKTIDIRCKVIVNTTSVTIEGQGVKSLCSLYISGGRNVALRQNATQTSTYSEAGDEKIALRAVDGNTDGIFTHNTCTHTGVNDSKPSWNVPFEHEHVLNRVILYNRNDGNDFRLQKFILQGFDTKKVVYRYQDQSIITLPIYYVNLTETESITPVTGLNINASRNVNDIILTLCEVEAYGECAPGTWGLECEKKCGTACTSTCHVETGTCPVCYGFPYPPECNTVCATGKWGFNCGNTCNVNCWENSCDRINGTCDKGCNGQQDFPSCIRACESGWFGKNCQFKCHCAGYCEPITGQCFSNPTCLSGWFGSSCQYVDLVSIPSATISTNPAHLQNNWITDRNESTCNTDVTLERVTVSWSTAVTFTWLRVSLSNTVYLGSFAVSFTTRTGNISCLEQKMYVINTKTIDIRCKVTVNTTSVILEGQGVKSLCSLYVSGGRDVALKQKAAQTTTYVDGQVRTSASNAVDGNTNGSFSSNTCTHTNDSNPSWNVTFDQPQLLNRIVLYNRIDSTCNGDCGLRLQNFILESMYANKTVFHYQDQSSAASAIYNVTVTENETSAPVNVLTIKLNGSNKPILTLCEVEAYGECVPGSWDLNCNKQCNTTCNSTCNIETGACQTCNGYKDPPNCKEPCIKGTWGLNCGNNCNNNCSENSCNNVTGVCDKACNGFKDFPNCSQECDPMTWGPNCSSQCNVSCLNSSCNRITGLCNLGCNGYINPPNCTKECPPDKWGPNCTRPCNSSCFNSSCDRLTGQCNLGCYGFSNPPNCNKECDHGQAGLNCTNQCDNCYNKTCNSQTGLCGNGCDGFSNPPNCSIPCNHGLWGLNCSRTCKENCLNKSCNRQTGLCDEGCYGYKNPPICDEVCTPGQWGINCTSPCEDKCWNGSCDHRSGQCDKGCHGYKNPPNCTDECDGGYWSLNCSFPCSTRCINASCHRLTGECYQGCHAGYSPPLCEIGCNEGYYGINCSYQCSANCSNNQCNSTVGHCFICNIGHTGQFCEALSVASPTDEPTPIGAIVGPIIAVIVISVLIFAGVMLWRRSRASKRAKNHDGDVDDANESKRLSNAYHTKFSSLQKKQKGSNDEDETDNSNGQGIYNNEGTYANLQNTSIAITDLYSFMHSHNKDYFEQQFKNIPIPKNVTTEVGMSSLNKHKNRYKNICTYDHSRVHLEINTAKNEGDYINASYIKGLKKQDQFIASQGPNNIMLNDFIRMLWEQQVDKVVMLTNLIEEGTVKCEKYWPDEVTKQFGEIQMKLISTQTFSDYVIRLLELSKPSEAARIFTQYHFTSWPDKGVPSAPWGLVDFEQRVSAKPTSRPIVVHCSAGVGRTGTYIALSNVLREAEETGRIDFFKTVMRLRQDRVLMIQTAEQYWFLHRAAQVAIVCIGTTVTSNDIVGRIKKLDERSATGKTKLEEEFKAVCEVCNELVEEPLDVEDSTTEDGNVYNNIQEMSDRSKNRFISIIPKQKYRPFLACENQNMGDYINAVFLPGFTKKDQQLLTQLPMPKTIIDFWRMVTQYKVSLIVAFELDATANDETFGQYLPAGVDKSLKCSPYLVRINDIKSSSLCEEQKLIVETEKQKSLLSLSSADQAGQSVIHLKCLFTDLDPVKLLRFIRQVRSYNALANGRILYTCSNGAKYSGLACVLSLLLDRMEHDSCLTVPLVVGTIKTIRPEVIYNLDQYKVLYQVLQKYSNNSVQYESLWDAGGNTSVLSTTKNPAFDENQDTDANVYANF